MYHPTPGDRIRVEGFDGPVAIIVALRTKAGAIYYKARVERSGALVWPNRAVADSRGFYLRTCTDCAITFRTDALTEVLCPNCDGRRR